MKNLTLPVVLASLVAASLTGCGSKSKKATTAVETPAADTSKQPTEAKPVDTSTDTADLPATPAEASLVQVIGFEFDSSTLSDDARDKLQQNADWLRDDPARTLVIEGHTDQTGTDEYNLALGDRRARAAQDYLIRLGIEAGRLEVLTFGEMRPVGTDDAANRRAVFVADK
jgi:peptidoglycan-associated lipoprotein